MDVDTLPHSQIHIFCEELALQYGERKQAYAH